jgi:hypothetical protein
MDDESLTRMIRDAHRETLRTPLSAIVRRRQRRWLSGAMVVSVGAAVIVAVAIGTISVVTGHQSTDPQSGVGAVAPTGKPARPSSSADSATERCVDYATDELFEQGIEALPPLRFQTVVVQNQLDLLMYADDSGDVACWLTPTSGVVSAHRSDLTTTVRPSHPAGTLTNSSSAYGQEPFAAYSFGRVPPGATQVDITFPDSNAEVAQLKDGWYLYTATAAAAHRLSDVTAIVATVNSVRQTLPVMHG